MSKRQEKQEERDELDLDAETVQNLEPELSPTEADAVRGGQGGVKTGGGTGTVPTPPPGSGGC